MKTDLTAERARELLAYDPEMGVLRWKVKVRYGLEPGSLAGNPSPSGYWNVMVAGRSYRAHRLGWLIVHGEWPEAEIDHANGVKDDNRLSNLRPCSHAENMQNMAAYRSSLSGLKGVLTDKTGSKRFKARIKVSGKYRYLGRFDSAEEAHAAYCVAKRQLHQFNPEVRAA